MRFSRSQIVSLFSILSLALLTSCQYVRELSKEKKATEEEEFALVDKAISAKDIQSLDSCCMRGGSCHYPRAKEKACKSFIPMLAEKGEKDKLQGICDTKLSQYYEARHMACDVLTKSASEGIKKVPCDKVWAEYKKIEDNLQKSEQREFFFVGGMRIAECKDWEHFFKKFVTRRGRVSHDAWGYKLLKMAKEKGVDVRAAILEHLNATQGEPFAYPGGPSASGHVADFLINSKTTGDCTDFIPFAKATTKNGDVMDSWVSIFWAVDCKAAADTVASYLSSGEERTRKRVCGALGIIGNKKHIRQMAPLAKSDPAFKIKGLVKIYFVRNACQASILRLKSK